MPATAGSIDGVVIISMLALPRLSQLRQQRRYEPNSAKDPEYAGDRFKPWADAKLSEAVGTHTGLAQLDFWICLMRLSE